MWIKNVSGNNYINNPCVAAIILGKHNYSLSTLLNFANVDEVLLL